METNSFEVAAKILEVANQQEALLLKIREGIEKRGKNPNDSTTYNFERAKLIGIISILDKFKIKRNTFNWIF